LTSEKTSGTSLEWVEDCAAACQIKGQLRRMGEGMQFSARFGKKAFEWSVLLSMVGHAALLTIAVRVLPEVQSRPEPKSIRVKIAEAPPRAAVPASPPAVKTPPPAATPQPKIRVDKRVTPPPAPQQQPPEERAGLSDSLALPGTARTNAPAVAVGNSSLAEVNPEDANKPPPSALPAGEPEPVAETLADAPARCPLPPSLELTTDALNAGVTNAEVVIEVAIASNGLIQDAKIRTGTGFEIDKVAVKVALKLRCSPAIIAGRPVAVVGKKLVWKVMYD